MSATMASQGGRLQLSDMHLALNMAKTVKEQFSRASIEETQYVMKKPRAKVREEKQQGHAFPRNKKMKAAIETHPAMLRQNHTAGCLSWQHGTSKFCRHAGNTQEQVNLHLTDTDSRLPSGCHRCPECHLPQLVTIPKLNIPKLSIRQLHMHIHIHLYLSLNFLLLMHLPRIASTIQIVIQIC